MRQKYITSSCVKIGVSQNNLTDGGCHLYLCNFLPRVLATDLPTLVLPTPGAPTKQRIGPSVEQGGGGGETEGGEEQKVRER